MAQQWAAPVCVLLQVSLAVAACWITPSSEKGIVTALRSEWNSAPPSGVSGNDGKKIPDGAFKDCTELVEIDIPSGIVKFGNEAFSGATSLVRVGMPETLHDFSADSVFNGASILRTLDFSRAVGTIGQYFLRNAGNLLAVELPSTVTEIGQLFCYGCQSLVNLTLGLHTVPYFGFGNAVALANLTLLSNTRSIEPMAFYNTVGLTSINLGGSLTQIGFAAFELLSAGSRRLSLYIPDSVSFIDSAAFSNTGVASVRLPPAVGLGMYPDPFVGSACCREGDCNYSAGDVICNCSTVAHHSDITAWPCVATSTATVAPTTTLDDTTASDEMLSTKGHIGTSLLPATTEAAVTHTGRVPSDDTRISTVAHTSQTIISTLLSISKAGDGSSSASTSHKAGDLQTSPPEKMQAEPSRQESGPIRSGGTTEEDAAFEKIEAQESGDDDTGVIIGATVGSIAGVALIGTTVYFIRRRRSQAYTKGMYVPVHM